MKHRILILFALFSICFASFSCSAAVPGSVETLPILSDEFRKKLGLDPEHERPFVIDFNATWCMPCLRFAPIYLKLKNKYKGQIDLVECDIDRNRDIMATYRVSSIPCVILFDCNGKAVKRYNGVPQEFEFEESLLALLETSGVDMVADDSDSDAEYYTIDGTKTDNPSSGLYIVKTRGEVKKVYIR